MGQYPSFVGQRRTSNRLSSVATTLYISKYAICFPMQLRVPALNYIHGISISHSPFIIISSYVR